MRDMGLLARTFPGLARTAFNSFEQGQSDEKWAIGTRRSYIRVVKPCKFYIRHVTADPDKEFYKAAIPR